MTEAEELIFDEQVGRGLVAALHFVNENCQRWPGVDDIRRLHQLLFAEAHPAIGGAYRNDTYWPQYSRFAVPRWQDVPACMLRLDDLLLKAKLECEGRVDFERQEKLLEWAARLHHRFECIHPFQDGNGRTGRAMVSWMLTHYGLPPLDLPLESKPAYIAALEAADSALTTQDLLHADYWPHQTTALQPLVDLIGDVLESAVGEGLDLSE